MLLYMLLARNLCHPHSHPGNLWRRRQWQGYSSLQRREESWEYRTNKVCGFLYFRTFDWTYFFFFFFSWFYPKFYVWHNELHWNCSVLHKFTWMLVEQTHKYICTYTANNALLKMVVCMLCIFPFVVVCLHRVLHLVKVCGRILIFSV